MPLDSHHEAYQILVSSFCSLFFSRTSSFGAGGRRGARSSGLMQFILWPQIQSLVWHDDL